MQAEAAQPSLSSLLSTGASAGANRVVAALQKAAAKTGSDFHYLLGTAMRESSLKPNAQSGSSSATGLFQFIDQTWLMTMKESGAEFGYGRYADAIEKSPSGRYTVRDPALPQDSGRNVPARGFSHNLVRIPR